MYAVKKSLAVLLALVLCVGMLAIPTYAAEVSQDGLEVTLTTDKDVYDQGETIVATLTVTNTGDADVVNVSLENLIPEGYAPAEGNETVMQVETLAAGETVTLTVSFVAEEPTEGETEEPTIGETEAPTEGVTEAPTEEATEKPTTGDKPSKGDSPDTGDDSALGLWVLLLVAAVIGLSVLAVKSKLWKQMLSLVLCMAMIGAVGSGVVARAEATEVLSGTLSVSEEITVDGDTLTIGAVVKYGADAENDGETVGLPKPENPSPSDDYYWDNSIVIDVINADESEDVPTAAEVTALLEERGFDNYPITYEYTMGGEYVGNSEIVEDSAEKYPMYMTYYVSENRELWTIFVVNGVVMANPASYNLEFGLEVQLLISESDTLTSYDDETNQFYVTIPYETTVMLKTVDRIDADTLNSLTIEEIDKL